jgi:methylthioribose-1-phosphate isomerase
VRIRAVEWMGNSLRMLDQTRLPAAEVFIDASSPEEVVQAIERLAVRGAPLLGIVAGYGVALGGLRSNATGARAVLRDLERAGGSIRASRPTAVNIAWAADRVVRAARLLALAPNSSGEEVRRAAVDEALAIALEDEAACSAIGGFGADLISSGANVLTHCNTGALATGGDGTALGVLVHAARAGKQLHVWVSETRPLLQGSRLTAWELRELGIPMTLVVDTAVGSLMARGQVDVVIVGADRIVANGDVANKIGTYQLAVLAHHHRVPFYVAAPISTVDLHTSAGDGIVIEQRDPREVTEPFGQRLAPEGVRAANPAFDVTPAALVGAIITNRGVARRPYGRSLRHLVQDAAASAHAAAGR